MSAETTNKILERGQLIGLDDAKVVVVAKRVNSLESENKALAAEKKALEVSKARRDARIAQLEQEAIDAKAAKKTDAVKSDDSNAARVTQLKKELAEAEAAAKKAASPGLLDHIIKPSNKSPVPNQYFYVAIIFTIVAVIGSIVAIAFFPQLAIPVFVGLALWIGLLVVWQVVLHFVNKAVWATSTLTVRLIAIVPYITGLILALLLLASVAHDAATKGDDKPVVGCYPNIDAKGPPVPLYSSEAQQNAKPVKGWQFDYENGTCFPYTPT